METGQHFWAVLDGKLVMMCKCDEDEYYVCGGWEVSVPADEFTVIKTIDLPEGYTVKDLYYQ